jgi:hypothetical protein
MMNIDFHDVSLYLLPIANAVLLGASALVLVSIRSALRERAPSANLSSASILAAELPKLSRNSQLMALRLNDLQKKIEGLSNLERLLAEPIARSLPMERATILARNGASEDELARTCGLSIGEARLMRRLHRGGTSQ